MSASPPDWWVVTQQDFAELLRTPLGTHGGRFGSEAEARARIVARVINDGPGADARLKLYHEQYWMRLFDAMQGMFRRTAAVTGYWTFNRLVTLHLTASPPVTSDLADCADGFFAELRRSLDGIATPGGEHHSLVGRPARDRFGALLREVDAPWSLLAQAAAVDEAERRAFRSPWITPHRRVEEANPNGRVAVAPSLSVLRLDWDVISVADADEPRRRDRMPHGTHVVVWRAEGGVCRERADAVLARLLSRVRREPVATACEHLMHLCPEPQRDALRLALDRYCALALTVGWWTPSDPEST